MVSYCSVKEKSVAQYSEFVVHKLDELLALAEYQNVCVFRGICQKNFGLETKLFRAFTLTKLDSLCWPKIEQKTIIEFQRQAHQYLIDLPEKNNFLEWLSIMQHYGSPTRLLDFTRSLFIALFFAVENASDQSCALWLLNKNLFNLAQDFDFTPSHKSSYDDKQVCAANTILSNFSTESPTEKGIIVVEPFRKNERLSLQQGVFLFPKNLRISFEENLCSYFGKSHLSELQVAAKADKEVADITKIVIPRKLHSKIMFLLASMNISAATLFPGLDGYARSQFFHLRHAEFEQDQIAGVLKQFPKILAQVFQNKTTATLSEDNRIHP
jgi:hypothetical protein